MTGSPLLNAIVKSVLSVDTLILRGQTTPTHPIPKERVFHLEGIQAVGRSGGRDQPDQLWYFESREYLRLLLVGRPISFKLLSAPTATSNEFGIAYTAAGVDIALEIVKAGWGIVREIKNADEDDPRRISLRAAEVEAKAAAKGKWSLPLYRDIRTSMPEDPVEFLAEFKNRPIEAVVESVSNGASARIRLLFSPTLQQFINLRLAGINAPRTQNANGEGGEPFGDEVSTVSLIHPLIIYVIASHPTYFVSKQRYTFFPKTISIDDRLNSSSSLVFYNAPSMSLFSLSQLQLLPNPLWILPPLLPSPPPSWVQFNIPPVTSLLSSSVLVSSVLSIGTLVS